MVKEEARDPFLDFGLKVSTTKFWVIDGIKDENLRSLSQNDK